MLTTILMIIALIVVALLVYAATKPGTFRIERNDGIKATPDKILALIEDFREWRKWSPWEKLDPNLKRDLFRRGERRRRGLCLGRQQQGRPRAHGNSGGSPRAGPIKLDFLKPFKANNTAEFTLTPAGGTPVNWAMYGAQPFMVKAMSIFFDMEKMVGPGLRARAGKNEKCRRAIAFGEHLTARRRAMLYALLCYGSEDEVAAWTREHEQAVLSRCADAAGRMDSFGARGPAFRLMPTTTALTLRPGAEPKVLDGPFERNAGTIARPVAL